MGRFGRRIGTGLVGGQTADSGPSPVILSLERLNRIRAVLPDDGPTGGFFRDGEPIDW